MTPVELAAIRFRYEAMVMTFDVRIEGGSFVAIIGPSGAGKSTLLSLIAGFDRPESGRVLIGGQDQTPKPPAARPVTMLFQEHNLFPHLTAGQNVGLGIHPGLRLGPADRDRVDHALARVGLDGFAERLPREMSGGERQRVALARSLVRRRPVLLLDEPFAALGPALRQEMVGLVDQLRWAEQLTVLMVSHQVDEVRLAAERVLFVADGRIIADGSPADLERAERAEVAAYLGTPATRQS